MKKINVMHLRSGIRGSSVVLGAEGVILKIVQHLDKTKFQPIVVSFRDPKVEIIPLLKEVEQQNISTEVINLRGRFDIFSSTFQLRKLFKKYDVDILHCHEYKSDFIGLLATRFTDVKLITTQHLWAGEGLRAKLYECFDSLIVRLRSFEEVIAVSEDIKETLLRKKCSPPKIVVIHNGIDVDLFEKKANQEEAKREFNIDLNAKVIGSVGRLSPQKGYSYLLEAAAKVTEALPEAIFVLVGDGPLKEDLIAYAQKLGLRNKIIFAGFRTDIARIMSMFDLFVMSSLIEGTPLALLEAMASAKPIVATNVGGIPSLVKNNYNGILVESRDSDALATQIIKLLQDKNVSTQMGLKARDYVKQNFSVKDMVKGYEDLYAKIMTEQ